MKRIFLLMSLFAFVCLANAQTQSTITGKVKDAATGEFLMGVNVRTVRQQERLLALTEIIRLRYRTMQL